MKAYYFGCVDRPGHYWFGPGPSSVSLEERDLLYQIDGIFCPPGPEIEGLAQLVYLNLYRNYTLISFWDRSVDTRGKCNSNFFLEGTFSFEEMVKYSKELFPTIWDRYKFKIVRWQSEKEGIK